MRAVALYAMALSLMLVSSPAVSTVMIAVTPEDESSIAFASEPATGWSLAPVASANTHEGAIEVIGDTLATYASMLSAPSDWVMLVLGFGVIGYAMRSRKQARVSFN